MNLMPPPGKRAKVMSCPINELADIDLSEIFKRLPPIDRLIASAVCRQWHVLIRNKAWLDVTYLELEPIPRGVRVSVVVRQCPNLQSFFAREKITGVNALACLSRAPRLSTVKFYGCDFKVDLRREPSDAVARIFSENIQHTSWDELVLHDSTITIPAKPSGPPPEWFLSARFLPTSLTRLQLTGFASAGWRSEHVPGNFLDGLERLENLECLMLGKTKEDELVGPTLRGQNIFQKIGALKKLKELAIGPVHPIGYEANLAGLIESLPKLEVLFLSGLWRSADSAAGLKAMLKSAVLRILLIADVVKRAFCYLDTVRLPPRKHPLPVLHIFTGGETARQFAFPGLGAPPSDAAVVHQIGKATLPEFLEQEDIAPIFKGVWLTEKIREAGKIGAEIW